MTKDVIDKLRDDKHYYGDFGRKFLSNSDIGSLLWSPDNFRKNKMESKALLEGRYFHTTMLEPDKLDTFHISKANVRRGKVWDAEVEEFGENILLEKERDHLEMLAYKMKSNLYFYDLIYDAKNKYEEPGIMELFGELWKGKADVVSDDYIIDLKTTSSISDFRNKVSSYCYDSQAYIYRAIFGKPMLFLVVDKRSARLGQFAVSEHTYDRGRLKVSQAVDAYRKYYGPNPTEDITNYYIHEVI